MNWEASLTILQLDITASPKQPRELAEKVVSDTPDAVASKPCRACYIPLESLFPSSCDGQAQTEVWPM